MEPKKIKPRSLKRLSIQRLRMELSDVSYLSNDLLIASLTPDTNHTSNQPISINGFAAIIMVSGDARISIDGEEYDIIPSDIVFFSPESVIRTIECSADGFAFLLSSSKQFMEELKIDLSTSLAIYMRFGRNPILHVSRTDMMEIRQLFRLIKRMLSSDKERYRNEIISTLFATIFYILSDLNSRENENAPAKLGRAEVLFDEFRMLIHSHCKQERNVGFYAERIGISAKYLSSISKTVSGKSAAQWIDEAVIVEAKSLLLYSGMSVNEVARDLNFSTQSFFGKFFKHHVGISPSKFKRNGGI